MCGRKTTAIYCDECHELWRAPIATQKELREAFKRELQHGFYGTANESVANQLAREAYPPKLATRPRAIEAFSRSYRVRNGVVEMAGHRNEAERWWQALATAEEFADLLAQALAKAEEFADLLAHSTETVEEDK
jgi:hypothetical protein